MHNKNISIFQRESVGATAEEAAAVEASVLEVAVASALEAAVEVEAVAALVATSAQDSVLDWVQSMRV